MKQINYFDTPEYRRRKGDFMSNFMNWVIKKREQEDEYSPIEYNRNKEKGNMLNLQEINTKETIKVSSVSS